MPVFRDLTGCSSSASVPVPAGVEVFEIQGMGDKVIEIDAVVIETDFVPLLEVKLPL